MDYLPADLYDEMVEDFGPWHAGVYVGKLREATLAFGGLEDDVVAALQANPRAFYAPVYNTSVAIN